MNQQNLLGQEVQCFEMASDSFFEAVQGTVLSISNGWATVRATQVMSKWDVVWQTHPGSCLTSCRVDNLKNVDEVVDNEFELL